MFKRALNLPKNHSFLLWGARQTGKSTLLKQHFNKKKFVNQVRFLDLLLSEEYRRYSAHPELLRKEILNQPVKWVVIDEVQKVPRLLSEAHWLMENKNIKFALCGSSVRQLKKSGVHLLGGRALRYKLKGLTAKEVGSQFQLKKMLTRGYLPATYHHPYPKKMLSSYLSDYIKQEVAGEALVRNLTPFSDFLEKSALSDTEIVSYSTFARDCAVSGHTIKEYYSILSDTLLGSFLPSYKKREKRRVFKQPKFYFSNIGLVNSLINRFSIDPKNESYGKAFENWLFHELKCSAEYYQSFEKIFYWKLASGIEVDFVIDDMRIAIEAKSSEKIRPHHLKGLRKLAESFKVKKRLVVCCEPAIRKTTDGILIVPYKTFVQNIKHFLN